jgi:predicted transcriptional regulator
MAKLTESDVRAIRLLHEQGLNQMRIADLFPVTQGAISDILSGQTWKHVT